MNARFLLRFILLSLTLLSVEHSYGFNLRIRGNIQEYGTVVSGKQVNIAGYQTDTAVTTDQFGNYSLWVPVSPFVNTFFKIKTTDCKGDTLIKTAYYFRGMSTINVNFFSCEPPDTLSIQGLVSGNGIPAEGIKLEISFDPNFDSSKTVISNSQGRFSTKIVTPSKYPGYVKIRYTSCSGYSIVNSFFYYPSTILQPNIEYCKTDKFRQIIGYVTNDKREIFPGDVRLELYEFRERENKFILVDTTINSYYGRYSLAAPNPGKYLVKAFPASPKTGLLPSYFGNARFWSDAELIEVNYESVIENNIFLPSEAPTSGVGSIIGFGEFSTSFSGNADLNTLQVLLLDNNRNPISSESFSPNGSFAFDNLPYGSFYLSIDILGLPHNEIRVDLNPEQNVKDGVRFLISDQGVGQGSYLSGSPSLSAEKNVKIYPIPFNKEFFVESQSGVPCSLQILNLRGETIFLQTETSVSHVVTSELWENGVYIIEIITPIGSTMKKVIKN